MSMTDLEAAKAEIAAKDRRIAELEEQVRALEEQVRVLSAQVRDLLAQLGRNSNNSSLPPSRDGVDARAQRVRKPKSKRSRGGQKGHRRAMREMVPPERVDEVVEVKPTKCGDCGRALGGEDPEPRRRQVTEIPEIVAQVIEYRLHTLTCPCGHHTRAAVPLEAAHGSFGPRLSALVALLTGGYGVSKRNAQELLSDVLGVDLALGSVSKLEARASEALASACDEVLGHVRRSPCVNMDETGWVEDHAKAWLWVASTPEAAYYRIAGDRSSGIVTDILGAEYEGVIGSDRAKAYLVHSPELRQVCWFHLGRNFQAKIELGGEAEVFGKQMRAFEGRMWRAEHGFAAGDITQESYDHRMKMVQGEMHRALEQWSHHEGDGIAGMCKNLLQLEPALWNFVGNPDVEPTNNRAERDIRPAVVWRRRSFGTDSPAGSRFAERILTVVRTCKRQARRAFEYLTEAMTAARRGLSAPPLLLALA